MLPYQHIIILLFLLSLPHASLISFQIQQFDANATGIIYEGDAEPVDGVVELTNKVNYVGRVGRATYAEKIPLWDSHNRKFSDFNTHFSFLIDKKGQGTYGSGFAFYLAPWGYQIPTNSGGNFLGLFNKTTKSSMGDQVVVVEFDSYIDSEWDPSYQHVGININSIASDNCTFWNVNLHDEETTEVWINYNSSTTNLSVHWSYKDHAACRVEESTSLSYIIDLTKILPEWISIGFSAATSQYGERHKILSWKFNSTLDGIPPTWSIVTHAKKSKRLIIVVLALTVIGSIGVVIGLSMAKPAKEWWNRFRNWINRPTPISAVQIAERENVSTHKAAGSRMVPDPEAGQATDSSFPVGRDFHDIDNSVMEKPPSNSGQGSRQPSARNGLTEETHINNSRHQI